MEHSNRNRDFPGVPKSFHDKLCTTLAQLPNKEEMMMTKKISFRRTLVFAAIAVMVLATTAFAVGKIYSTGSHSYGKDRFTQLPTASQMETVMGVEPKVLEQFDNGYQFEKGTVFHAEDTDEGGAVLSTYKGYDLSYADGSNSITLTMTKQKPGMEIPTGCTQTTYNGITLYAFDYIDKMVPLGYVKTQQDLLDEASGKISFSTMGGDTVEITDVQMLFWADDGVSYTLLTQNNPLAGDELAAMAKQLLK